MSEAYDEWVKRNRPQDGRCWNGPPGGNQITKFECDKNEESNRDMEKFWKDILYGDGALGIVGTLGALSTSAGALANTYTYDSFGNRTTSTGSVTNRFQYAAREFDTETNLYYYRAREYDQSIGRFLREDPSGFRAGVNFYAYVQNDPEDFRDPTGLYSLKGFTAAQQVDMMNAINLVRKKLEECPSCVTDPSLRKRLLGYLGGDNDGSGQTFIFSKEKLGRGDCAQTRGITKTTYIADWKTTPGCSCLPSNIIHELVHDTWENLFLFGDAAEKVPNSVDRACFPSIANCKF